ncbi:DUF4907 domain-containing protein [Larkinella bovis]|uniref:DUF4907 domain-containing protein n=1 Tax=Larkinella bovis TaxID=683041 RepID=A0ABW0IGG7_9BACT
MKRRPLQSFALLLLGLTAITVYSLFRPKPQYELRTLNSPTGWGYRIVLNGKPVIDQPTVPGQSGQRGFVSEALARRVGERVVSKLKLGQFPPTLTPAELNQLGVPIQ